MESSGGIHDTVTQKGLAAVAARGSAWTTAQTLANKFLTALATLVLAKLLAPADFGLANVAISVGVLAFVLAPFVMGDVLLSQPTQFQQNAATARVIAWTAAILLALGLMASALPIERFTQKPGLAFLLIVIVAQRPLADALFMVPNSRLRMALAYRAIAIIDGSVILSATVLGIGMAWAGMGPASLLFPPIAMIWARAFIYAKAAGPAQLAPFDRARTRPLTRRFVVAGMAQYLNSVLAILEVFILGFVANETEIGLYGFAAMLAIQANSVIASQLGAVLQPIFAHIQSDAARQVSAFIRATTLLSSFAVPLSLTQAALAMPLFRLLFEAKWTGSIAIFATLSIAQAFVFVGSPSTALLKAQGRFRAYFAWQFMQLAGSAVLMVLAVNHGVALAASLAQKVGLPTSDDASRALALSIASAIAWAVSCPIGVWIAGRPAGASVRSVLSIFFTPWLAALPVNGALVLAWIGLQGACEAWIADLLALVLLGPIALVVSIGGTVLLRADTRADFQMILSRFWPRKKNADGGASGRP